MSLLTILALTSICQAQIISGPQSGSLGPGEYVVVGDISVPAGESLTIQPGTTFLHSGPYSWNIYGLLTAVGTETDSIYFVRQEPIGNDRWRSIRFQNGASDESVLDYCVIDNCLIPADAPSSMLGGGIFTHAVDITVRNTRISNCETYWHGAGIYAHNASILVENCLIVENSALASRGGGIFLYNCEGAHIVGNEIARNTNSSG